MLLINQYKAFSINLNAQHVNGMTFFFLTFSQKLVKIQVRLLDTLEKVGYTCTKFILRNNFTLCSIDLFDLFDHLPTHVATRCRHVEHKKILVEKSQFLIILPQSMVGGSCMSLSLTSQTFHQCFENVGGKGNMKMSSTSS